jgi:hypothetical protein
MLNLNDLGAMLASRPALGRRARVAPVIVVLKVGDRATTIRIGPSTTVMPGAAADSAFTLVIGSEAWAEYSQPIPKGG